MHHPRNEARLERWVAHSESRKQALEDAIDVLLKMNQRFAAQQVQHLLKRTRQRQADLLRRLAPGYPLTWAVPQLFLPTGPGEAAEPQTQQAA
jgi:hypothetical protein